MGGNQHCTWPCMHQHTGSCSSKVAQLVALLPFSRKVMGSNPGLVSFCSESACFSRAGVSSSQVFWLFPWSKSQTIGLTDRWLIPNKLSPAPLTVANTDKPSQRTACLQWDQPVTKGFLMRWLAWDSSLKLAWQLRSCKTIILSVMLSRLCVFATHLYSTETFVYLWSNKSCRLSSGDRVTHLHVLQANPFIIFVSKNPRPKTTIVLQVLMLLDWRRQW